HLELPVPEFPAVGGVAGTELEGGRRGGRAFRPGWRLVSGAAIRGAGLMRGDRPEGSRVPMRPAPRTGLHIRRSSESGGRIRPLWAHRIAPVPGAVGPGTSSSGTSRIGTTIPVTSNTGTTRAGTFGRAPSALYLGPTPTRPGGVPGPAPHSAADHWRERGSWSGAEEPHAGSAGLVGTVAPRRRSALGVTPHPGARLERRCSRTCRARRRRAASTRSTGRAP